MITSKHIDGTGTVHLWDLGPTKVRMAAVDARHAVEVEPERWALVDPNSPDKYVPEGERSESEFGGESAGDPPLLTGTDFNRTVTQYHPDPEPPTETIEES